MCTLIRHTFCECLVKLDLLNTNAVHFCDIIFRHRAVCVYPATKTVLEVKNPATLDKTKIIYLTISKYSKPLQKF